MRAIPPDGVIKVATSRDGVSIVRLKDGAAPVLIGWAVGELSALHTSVRGGDLREGPDDIDIASLGEG